jgi:hypothetical protein
MMSLVIDGFVNVLAAAPGAVLPAAHVGDRLPSSASGLPAISISLEVDPPRGNGLGRFAREGHQLIRNTTVLQAGVSPGFQNLASLALAAPPRRHPSSHSAGFSETDIGVRRVNDPSQPVPYRMLQKPAAREEFALDALRSLVRFGAPQQAGDKLEVTYWTLEFRDDIVPVRYSGAATLIVWAADAPNAASLARAVERKLSAARETLRPHGFALLNPTELAPAESVSQQVGAGSAFAVWKQRLRYRFAFETELGGETSAGGPIRRIDLEAGGELSEAYSVPQGP